MRGTPLATYTAVSGERRLVSVVVLGDALSGGARLPVAALAARLRRYPALLVDVRAERTGDERVVGAFEAGEGLLAVQALVEDYRPRAAQAARPLGRLLSPEDLIGSDVDTVAA